MNFAAEDDKWRVNEDETVVVNSKQYQVRQKVSIPLAVDVFPSFLLIAHLTTSYCQLNGKTRAESMNGNLKMWDVKN